MRDEQSGIFLICVPFFATPNTIVLGRMASSSAAVRSTPFPTMPSISTVQGPTSSGVSTRRSVRELGPQPLTLDSREGDLQGLPVLRRPHPGRRFRRHGLGHHGLCREVEGNAEDVGVLDREQPIRVELVGLPAQRAADHLVAEELRPEGAHAEDVRDSVRVPREARDGGRPRRGEHEVARLSTLRNKPRSRSKLPDDRSRGLAEMYNMRGPVLGARGWDQPCGQIGRDLGPTHPRYLVEPLRRER
jgi:hypothetical protein